MSRRLDQIERDVVRVVGAARSDLRAALLDLWPDFARTLTVADIAPLRALVEPVGARLARDLAAIASSARSDMREAAAADVAEAWRHIADLTPEEADALQVRLLALSPRLPDDLGGALDLTPALRSRATSACVQGTTRADVSRVLAGPERSVLSVAPPRIVAQLDRDASQTYHATAQASMEAVEQANARGGVVLAKQDVEIIDKRNHPISRVLDGQTVPISDPFVALVDDVKRAAREMGRPTGEGAILWPLRSDRWVGMLLPAHWHERGRVRLVKVGG